MLTHLLTYVPYTFIVTYYRILHFFSSSVTYIVLCIVCFLSIIVPRVGFGAVRIRPTPFPDRSPEVLKAVPNQGVGCFVS